MVLSHRDGGRPWRLGSSSSLGARPTLSPSAAPGNGSAGPRPPFQGRLRDPCQQPAGLCSQSPVTPRLCPLTSELSSCGLSAIPRGMCHPEPRRLPPADMGHRPILQSGIEDCEQDVRTLTTHCSAPPAGSRGSLSAHTRGGRGLRWNKVGRSGICYHVEETWGYHAE